MQNRNLKNPYRARLGAAIALASAAALAMPAFTRGQQDEIASSAPPSTTPAATTRPTNGNGHGGVTTSPGGGIMLNFKDASIDTVLDELSAVAGFVVVKEVKPEGRVSLVSKQPLHADDAVSLLNTVLKNAGYAAIQQGRILKVVERDKAKRSNIPVRSGADPTKIEPTDELITQVIPLRYADATQLKQDLQPLISADADFTANASSNALVMTDTSANIRRVVEIVSALDTHLADAADVKVFQLEYATAANAARLINELFGEQAQSRTAGNNGRGGGGGFVPNFGGFGGFPGGGGGFGGFGGFGGNRGGGGGGGNRGAANQQGQSARQAIGVNASSDDRTNTVVVTGPPDVLGVIARVVKELDSNPTADNTVYVYRLKNADSLNVEAVMNMIFNGTGSAANRSQPSLSTARSTPTNNTSSRGGGSTFGNSGIGGRSGGNSSPFGTTSTNRNTFGGGGGTTGGGGFGGLGISSGASNIASSLSGQVSIIADPATNSMLVRTAPKNYEQVKLVLAELDRPVAQVLIKVLIAEVTHNNSTDLGAEFSVLNLRAGGKGQSAGTNFNLANATGGGLVVQLLEQNVTATLRALENDGKLDVLSRPYILASDNQLASITVGQEIPFITDSRITDNGQTINTVEYGDIGILLDVIPHINPEGLVILDVAPEISTLTDQSIPITNQVSSPVIAKRSAQSRVGVQSGQTVVIGGLMEDRKTDTIDKIPLLGDIPLLGSLFQRHQNAKTKTELLIFMTPHVASEPSKLGAMSDDEMRGTKLVPNAVAPGEFQNHAEGLKRGEAPATTAPAAAAPVSPDDVLQQQQPGR